MTTAREPIDVDVEVAFDLIDVEIEERVALRNEAVQRLCQVVDGPLTADTHACRRLDADGAQTLAQRVRDISRAIALLRKLRSDLTRMCGDKL